MSQKQKSKRVASPQNTQVSVIEGNDELNGGLFCSCCDPENPLVLRPDFGLLGDQNAEYAICVLHDPEPMIYRQLGDGQYIQAPELQLSPSGDIVDESGSLVARVKNTHFQRLHTLDDDDSPSDEDPTSQPSSDRESQPARYHVDLSEDDFYR